MIWTKLISAEHYSSLKFCQRKIYFGLRMLEVVFMIAPLKLLIVLCILVFFLLFFFAYLIIFLCTVILFFFLFIFLQYFLSVKKNKLNNKANEGPFLTGPRYLKECSNIVHYLLNSMTIQAFILLDN